MGQAKEQPALALAEVGQVLFMALVDEAAAVALAAAVAAAAADLGGVVVAAQLQILELAAVAAFTMAATELFKILGHLGEVAAVRLVLVLEALQTRQLRGD